MATYTPTPEERQKIRENLFLVALGLSLVLILGLSFGLKGCGVNQYLGVWKKKGSWIKIEIAKSSIEEIRRSPSAPPPKESIKFRGNIWGTLITPIKVRTFNWSYGGIYSTPMGHRLIVWCPICRAWVPYGIKISFGNLLMGMPNRHYRGYTNGLGFIHPRYWRWKPPIKTRKWVTYTKIR